MAIKIQKLAKPSPGLVSLAAKAKAPPSIPASTLDILLDEEQSLLPAPSSLNAKLSHIEKLMAAEGIPIPRLRSGLQDVMQCIKENEGSILELEPKDIKLIVAGYMKAADREVSQIVSGKKKKGKGAEVAAMMKASSGEEVDF